MTTKDQATVDDPMAPHAPRSHKAAKSRTFVVGAAMASTAALATSMWTTAQANAAAGQAPLAVLPTTVTAPAPSAPLEIVIRVVHRPAPGASIQQASPVPAPLAVPAPATKAAPAQAVPAPPPVTKTRGSG